MSLPKILLLSGIHGDEYGVELSVKKYFKKQENKIASYLYISTVSPSAIKNKARNNKNNIDLNRSFLHNTKDTEILTLKQKLKGSSFFAAFTFHEDSDRKDGFYMYSSHELNMIIFSHFEKQLQLINMKLYCGIDDSNDPVLNNYIDNGLLISPVKKEKKGTLWPWLKKNNNITYYVDFEIPGKASQQKKDKLVQILFDCIIQYYQKLFL